MPETLIIGFTPIAAAVKGSAASGPILVSSLMGAYEPINEALIGGGQAPARHALFALEKPMSLRNMLWRVRRPLIVAMAAAAVIGAGTLVGLALPQYSISQKGREFHPGEITIKRGETIEIVNDDADLLHHAYIDSPKFSFDSGDQQPGSKTDVTFPVAGGFNVLCAIHPKMLLVVHVQ